MTQNPRIQDDLYLAINGDWQAKAVIPADKAYVGADSDLSDNIRDTLVADLTRFAQDPDTQTDHPLKMAAHFFDKARDFKTRNRLGIQPIQKRLAFLRKLTTLETFQENLAKLIQDCYALPFSLDVDSDFNNAQVYALYLTPTDLILPDSALYQKPNEDAQKWLAIWQKMALDALKAANFDQNEAQKLVQDALAFDRRIAKDIPDNVALADERTYNNPYSWQELLNVSQTTHLAQALAKLLPKTPDHVIVTAKAYFADLNTLVTAENYHEWYAMALIKTLLYEGIYLSNDWRILVGTYQRALYHQEEPLNQTKHAYRLTNRFFDDPIGVYYGKTYFGAEAKADITAMVYEIIARYQEQLKHNTWLSESTRQTALKKLDTMVVKMGYPDQTFALYRQFEVTDQANLLDTAINLKKSELAFWLPKIAQSVDRSQWAMPGHLVNACYNPSTNDITFPAGILQPPFYAYTWTRAQKLGGTGVTIGHEISHAFDNNGALFDEHGTMTNWWTDRDRKAFDQVIQAMIAQFDGQDYEGTKVNGKLSVSENLADNAGMAVALDLLKGAEKSELKDFFVAYTISWRTKMRPEFAKTILMQDVHAPASLRVNLPVQNFDAWYNTYEVTAADKLYLPANKRVHIWTK